MARKSRITSLVLDYIAKDDSAIGIPEGPELDQVYDKYLSSKDLTLLQLDSNKMPCIYRLKVFNTQKNWESVREAFAALDGEREEGEELDSSAWGAYLSSAKLAIRDRFVGCKGHPMIRSISNKGELEEVIMNWDEGQPQPAGVLDDILSQDDLVAGIFRFLVQAATLTDAQKKD